jgi:hypothetical protein
VKAGRESSPASAAAVSAAQQQMEVTMNTKQSRRIPLSLVVLFAAAVGVTAWTPAPSTTAAQPAPEMIAIPGDSYYFPAQYVNQAKELEPHIQAF